MNGGIDSGKTLLIEKWYNDNTLTYHLYDDYQKKTRFTFNNKPITIQKEDENDLSMVTFVCFSLTAIWSFDEIEYKIKEINECRDMLWDNT